MISTASAKRYLKDIVGPQRRIIIETLREIISDIQRLSKMETAANVLFSSIGILCSVVTVIGCYKTKQAGILKTGCVLGASSFGVKVFYDEILNIKISKKLADAATLFKEHQNVCSTMMKLLTSLQEKINLVETLQIKIEAIQQTVDDKEVKSKMILPFLKEIGLLIGKNIAPDEQINKTEKLVEIGRSIEKVLYVETIGKIESLIVNLDDLAKHNKGDLCALARSLDLMMKELQWELKEYERWSDNTN